MKKTSFYLLFLFILSTSSSFAQNSFNIYYEKNKNGYNVFADNNEYCPTSVKINFEATNLKIDGGNNQLYVINPLTKRQLLTTLTILNKRDAYQFKYTYKSNLGNENLDFYDSEFIYDLPFSNSKSFKVSQGYNGNISHTNQNAIDFSMPLGTEINAIRDGIVIKVVQENSKNCSEEFCKIYNNYIIIYHSDGTFAEYTHIQKDGATVKVGDNIKKGDVIAYSGNVGWSTGPHLHVVVFLQKLENRKTIETKFKIGNGEKSDYLMEKVKYERNY